MRIFRKINYLISLVTNLKPKIKMDRTITITRGYDSGKLDLDESQIENPISGDQITWVIKSGSGVATITKIHEKAGSQNIFVKEPSKQPDGSWMGTLKDVTVAITETYYINWTTSGSGWLGNDNKGIAKTDDPQIRVNPK